jgi:hypothetical protein
MRSLLRVNFKNLEIWQFDLSGSAAATFYFSFTPCKKSRQKNTGVNIQLANEGKDVKVGVASRKEM